jgi:hypothetical protein
MKTFEERKVILENEVTKQLKKGWRIISKTETGCQLQKEKGIDGCLSFFLFCLVILPGILYLIVAHGKTISIFIEVSESGEIIYSSQDVPSRQLNEASMRANAHYK